MSAIFRTLVLLASLLPSLAAGAPLRVVTTPDVLADYQRFLAGRPPQEITRYGGPGARRDVVELVLVQQALALGGEPRAAELVTAPTYRRLLALVADGHADITGNSVWASDIDALAGRLRASSALIEDGRFVAALYRAEQAREVDALVLAGQWHRLTAVSSREWGPDWLALQRLGLAQLYDVNEWPAMVRMVAAGRSAFLLAPHQPGTDPRVHFDGLALAPVPGVCLALPGSRHLAVTGGAGGERLLAALERGLAELRRRQTLERAYTESGFFSAISRHCTGPAAAR